METVLTNARLILDDGVVAGTLTVRDGRIVAQSYTASIRPKR